MQLTRRAFVALVSALPFAKGLLGDPPASAAPLRPIARTYTWKHALAHRDCYSMHIYESKTIEPDDAVLVADCPQCGRRKGQCLEYAQNVTQGPA